MHPYIVELRREHGEMARLMRTLWFKVRALQADREEDYELMERMLAFMTDFPDRYHHPRENLLFDAISQRTSEVDDVIANLRRQHEEIASHGKELLTLLGAAEAGEPTSKQEIVRECHEYIMAESRHMHEEEFAVFPLAESVLTPAEWDRLHDQSAGLRVDEPMERRRFGDFVGELPPICTLVACTTDPD